MNKTTTSSNVRRSLRPSAWALVGMMGAAALATACSDDDNDDDMAVGGLGAASPTGTVQVLSADAALTSPTTVAIRGDMVFAPLAQFDDLFGETPMPDPQRAVSVALAGGELGDSVALPEGFYPEGITAAADGTLYIGSLTGGGIQRVPAGSTTAEEFLAPGAVAERGVVGLTVDNDRDLVWYCDSSPAATTPAGALVGLAAADATEVARHNLPNAGLDGRPAFCNDVIVTPEGDLLVSESWAGRIYRVPAANVLTADSAELWSDIDALKPEPPDTGFGVNGLELVGDQLVFANGGLFVMDPASPDSAQAITLTGSDTDFLGGADGLALVPGSTTELVVADNGGRIIKVTLDLQ